MTACSTERGRRRAPARRRGARLGMLPLLLPALLLVASPAPAQMQQQPARQTPLGPPLPLGPAPGAPGAATTPLPAPGTPSDESLDAAASQAAAAAAKAAISVAPLPGSGLEGVGTLDAGNGGLGPELWRGSDRATIDRLLPLLAPPENALALREAARRLLLSAAPPPAGTPSDGAPSGEAGRNFALLRADRLAALGDVDSAAALVRLVPERDRDGGALRLLADAAWLAGDVGAGCKLVEGAAARQAGDPELARAGVFCQAQAGQKDKAALGLDLLREQGQAGDPLFAALLDRLAGGPPAALESVTGLTPLLYAMLRTAGQALPPEAASAVPLAIAAALARDAKAAPEARLAAAERAAAAGLIDAPALARIYALQPAGPAELDAAATATEPPASPRDRALAWQAAQRGDAAARIPPIQRALAQARRAGEYRLAARLYLPVLRDLAPAGSPAFAAEAATALLAAGYRDRAQPWLAAAAADKATAGRAWLLQRLAKGGPLQPSAADVPALTAWYQAAKAADAGKADPAQADPAQADLQLARLLAVSDGLGQPVDALWPALIGVPALAQLPSPDPALLAALAAASFDRRKGEASLLALAALGRPEPRLASPAALAPALAALRRLDQGAAARDLALDAAIGNGL